MSEKVEQALLQSSHMKSHLTQKSLFLTLVLFLTMLGFAVGGLNTQVVHASSAIRPETGTIIPYGGDNHDHTDGYITAIHGTTLTIDNSTIYLITTDVNTLISVKGSGGVSIPFCSLKVGDHIFVVGTLTSSTTLAAIGITIVPA